MVSVPGQKEAVVTIVSREQDACEFTAPLHSCVSHSELKRAIKVAPQNSLPNVKETFLRPASARAPPKVMAPNGVLRITSAKPSCRRIAGFSGDQIFPASYPAVM
jgi:hypothetical protein